MFAEWKWKIPGESPRAAQCPLPSSIPSRAVHFLSQQKQYLKNISKIQYMRAATLRSGTFPRVGGGFERCCVRYAPPAPPAHTLNYTLVLCSRKMSIIRTARVSPVLLLIRRCHCSSAPIRSSLWGRRIWIALGRNYSIKEPGGIVILSLTESEFKSFFFLNNIRRCSMRLILFVSFKHNSFLILDWIEKQKRPTLSNNSYIKI